MAFGRLKVALVFAGSAVLCTVLVQQALAEFGSKKMIFQASHFDDTLEVIPSFSSKEGALTLDPEGSMSESIHVEILSSNGRSPASEAASAKVLKRLTISRMTSVHISSIGMDSSPVIRIRIMAP
jgi:hypothetical protein